MSEKDLDITFEEALDELQKIVGLLERGETPLDESLSQFERGVKLVKICNEKLETAKQKITYISEDELSE